MKNISLPDVDYEGGKMTDITMKLHEPESLEDIDFYLNPNKNSVIMKTQHLFAEMVG